MFIDLENFTSFNLELIYPSRPRCFPTILTMEILRLPRVVF